MINNLKEKRLELGLSQTDVAKNVGVSLVTYQNWEREVTKPKEENLVKLKSILKIK